MKNDISNFLKRYGAECIGHPFATETKILSKFSVEQTDFAAPIDSLFFANLISKTLELAHPENVEEIFDLGSGSSIPVLFALSQNPKFLSRIVAVDIDPKAKITGLKNSKSFALEGRFSSTEANLVDVLKDIENKSKIMVCSNPPYLPVASSLESLKFRAVNGGLDGAYFLEKILGCNFAKGTYICLIWSSLSNPCRIIDLIENKYQILGVQYLDAKFAKYTSEPEILDHLWSQSKKGEAVFFQGADKSNYYKLMGTILRANR